MADERTHAREFLECTYIFFVRAWVLINANKYAAAYVVCGAGRVSPATSWRRGVSGGVAFRLVATHGIAVGRTSRIKPWERARARRRARIEREWGQAVQYNNCSTHFSA